MRRALVAAGVLLTAGCAHSPTVASAPSSGATAVPSLSQVLQTLPLPPGTARVDAPAATNPDNALYAPPHGTRAATASWTSPLGRLATMAWLTAHLPATWTRGSTVTSGDAELSQTFDGPADASYDGPNLRVSVTGARSGSGSVVQAQDWEIPLAPKRGDETLAGVTSITAHLTNDNGSDIVPYTVAITGAAAQRISADINGLVADPGLVSTGMAGLPNATLVFHTSTGDRTFLAVRNDSRVQPVPQRSGDPTLTMSGALFDELGADLGNGVSTILPPPPHPVPPAHVRSVTAVVSWPDSHPKKTKTTVTITGAAARRLAAGVARLAVTDNSGRCARGKADLSLTFVGDGRPVHADITDDCRLLSSSPTTTSTQDQSFSPFRLSSAVVADLAADSLPTP